MSAELTSDQILAMDGLAPGESLVLVDSRSQKEYVLFDKDAYDHWIAQQVNIALDEADAEPDVELDIEAIKREAREEFAQRQTRAI
jgi:hypothetical protein